jgi:hypothetical protein
VDFRTLAIAVGVAVGGGGALLLVIFAFIWRNKVREVMEEKNRVHPLFSSAIASGPPTGGGERKRLRQLADLATQ